MEGVDEREREGRGVKLNGGGNVEVHCLLLSNLTTDHISALKRRLR